jgi:hypothetical protein
MVADFHSILAWWRNHFFQLLNVQGVNDVRQIEIHAAEPLMPEPRDSEFVMAIEKLKKLKSPGIYQIPAELIKAGSRTIHSEIHKLINSILNKEELPEQWKESIIVPIYMKGDIADYSNYRGVSLLSTTYKILSNIFLPKLTPYAEEIMWSISVDLEVTGRLKAYVHQASQCSNPLGILFYSNRSTTDHILCIRQILEKEWEYNEAVHQLFIDFKIAYDSFRRKVLNNILIEFGIPIKLVRLVKMCLNETHSRVWLGKHLSDTFPIKNGLK